MSLHKDLLGQARHLVRREPRRPKQASLRRAVSAAYYALFHLLIDASSRLVVRGADRAGLRIAVSRAFNHAEMKTAAKSFQGGTLPSTLRGVVVGAPPSALQRLCATFIDLQQARHEADYDLARVFTRNDAQDLVSRAEQAFGDWETVKGTAIGDVFLVTLLLRQKLDR